MPRVEFEGISKLYERVNLNLVRLLHITIIDKKKHYKPMGFEYPHKNKHSFTSNFMNVSTISV